MSKTFDHEIALCSLVFKSDKGLKQSRSSLLNYNNFLWITPALRDHLKKRSSATHSDLKNWCGPGSDWDHLYRAVQAPHRIENKKTLDFFARKSTYQLRYQTHEEYAIAFVEHLLQSYYRLMPLRKLWSSDLTASLINRLQNLFRVICIETKQNTVGGIYRLYDLCIASGTSSPFDQVDPSKFQLLHALALTFALTEGHLNGLGMSEKQKVRSISELVAKYNFFLKFSDDTWKMYRKNFSYSEAFKQRDCYLLSFEGLEVAKKLWASQLNTSTQFVVTNRSSPHFNNPGSTHFAHHIIDSLKSCIRSIIGYSRKPDPSVNCLPVELEAHALATTPNPQGKSRDDVDFYLALFDEVVAKNTIDREQFPPRPDQFDNESIYTFKKEIGGNTYQVIPKMLADDITFSLICQPTFHQQTTLIDYKYSISEYLTYTSEILKKSGGSIKEPVHLVMGNESADMDSIASAIAYSYANLCKGFYVPLINIYKAEIRLRKHVLMVFENLGIKIDSLLFKEDLNLLKNLAGQNQLRVTLVDHNRLAPHQKCFKGCVEEIIDHHNDDKDDYPTLEDKNKYMKLSASASTLIANKIMTIYPGYISDQEAYLLLCALLLDTKNFDEDKLEDSENKVESLDREMRQSLITASGALFTAALYNDLNNLRNNVEGFSLYNFLQLDFKTYKESEDGILYGIATLHKKCVSFSQKESRGEWKKACEGFSKDRNLQLQFAVAKSNDYRLMIVYTPDRALRQAVLSLLEQEATFKKEQNLSDENLVYFALDKNISRKELQPILASVIKKIPRHH